MPTPRQQAEKYGDRGKFENAEQGYDVEAGVPSAFGGDAQPKDYRTNPTNPPEPALPATNLKR